MKTKEINSKLAPKAIGPYSQAVIAGDLIFCSGQIGINPKNGELATGIRSQTKQALNNLFEVLKTASADFADILKVEIFLTNIDDFTKVNEIYSTFFTKNPKPARVTVEVSKLPKNALIEIACIALRKKQ